MLDQGEFTAARVRQLQILSVLRQLGQPKRFVPTDELVTGVQEFGWSEEHTRDIASDIHPLAGMEAVSLDLRLGNLIAAVLILPAGLELAEEFDALTSSNVKRRRQLRDDYLHWLYDQIENHDASPTPDDYLREHPRFLGTLYTEADLEKVGVWLKDNVFILGEAAWQYAGPLRPTLTAKGVYTVENGRSVNDPPPGAGSSITTNFNAPANVNYGGSNVTQEISFTWVQQASTLLDGVEQALSSLPEDLADSVRRQLDEAREELATTHDISRLRAILGKLAGFLSSTGSGALGGMLAAQLTNFLAG